ncbi:class I SAM-dependent methyltransferase [Elusimicrobiota bacterium]
MDVMEMINKGEILSSNKKVYNDLYTEKKGFLRYPADWIARFHNMYLKENLPTGKVLDYGCGSGNNSMFFIDKGYDVYGVDVAESATALIKENLLARHYDPGLVDRFSIMTPDSTSLPYKDSFFDLIISNQVLYYLPTQAHINAVCKELSRCLRPGGIVFFTMMGPKNYYITRWTKKVHDNRVHEVIIDDPKHRLNGVKELVYLIKDEEDLRSTFSEFKALDIGYFDQKMFDLTSNFHWIFIGQKPTR